MSFHLSAFDLVNIHLFHDASNLVAWEKSPSVYSGTRQKALGFVLDRYDRQNTGLPFTSDINCPNLYVCSMVQPLLPALVGQTRHKSPPAGVAPAHGLIWWEWSDEKRMWAFEEASARYSVIDPEVLKGFLLPPLPVVLPVDLL